MQTIKKLAGKTATVSLVLACLVSGCMPPGPRALLRGKKLLEQGKPQQALESLREAVTLFGGTNAQAFNYLGLACQQAGLMADAARAYARAIVLNPDLSEAHYNLGCLWLEQGRYDLAKNEFTAYTLRRSTVADGWLKLGTAQWHLSTAGSAYQRTAQLAASENAYRQGLILSPKNPEALTGLGLIRLRRGRPAEAAELFKQALKAQPDFCPAILNLAIVEQQDLRDPALALQQYRRYISLDPNSENRSSIEALIKELQRQLGEAAASSSASSTEARVISRGEEKVSSLAKSSSELSGQETTIERYPFHPPYTPKPGNRSQADRAFLQGERAQRAHDLEQAIGAYRSAVVLDPSFFEAFYNMGLAANQLGNLQLALSSYESAVAVRPQSSEARYNFALVLTSARYWLDAANELETVLAAHPNDVRSHLALANLYAQQLHLPDKARAHYLKVLVLDPANPQASQIRRWLAVTSH